MPAARDLILGLLAIGIGALFCFRGYLAMRQIIPLWGAFAGFVLGAGLMSSVDDSGFLRSVAAWIVGLVVALLFGMLAYLYFEVSVALAMAGIGFTLATSVLVALGLSWSWLIIIVGVAAGVVLALLAIRADFPMLLLATLTALAGASTIVAGAMLLFGVIETDEFTSAATTERLDEAWYWYVIYVALAVAGLLAQFRDLDRRVRTMRESWRAAGGRELRAG